MKFSTNFINKTITASILSVGLFTHASMAQTEMANDFFKVANTTTEIVDVSDAEYDKIVSLMNNMHMSCQDSALGGVFDTGSASPLTPFVDTAKDATVIVNEGIKIVDGLINIGSKIWSIVKAGKPVVNFNIGPSANALPQGAKCWDELETWQIPNVMRIKSVIKNSYGFALAEFQFDVVFTWGGSFNGKGQYLTHVQVFPSDTYTFFMQELNASVNVASIMNRGTKDDPIAGMQVDIKWQFKNFMNEVNDSTSVFVQGDGFVKKLY